MYVDDLLKSIATVTDATVIYHDIKELFAESSFIITKWSLNSEDVVKIIPEDDRASRFRQICTSTEDAPTQGPMGLQWTPFDDKLSLRGSMKGVINTK